MPQKTLPIAAVTKNAAIDLMYNGGPKTHRNRRHIAAVFALAAIGPPQLLIFLVVTYSAKKNGVNTFYGENYKLN